MELNIVEIPQRALTPAHSDEFLRLDRFLMRHGISSSRAVIKMIIEKGGVLINERLVTFPSKRVMVGDSVFVRRVLLPPFYSEGVTLNILHQDDEIIVVNKPPGLLTLPDNQSTVPSVFSRIKKILKGREKGIFPVHRLDKDTSGLLIFARNQRASEFLKKQFEEKRVVKKYIALLQANLSKSSGTIKGNMRASGEFGESKYIVLEMFKVATMVEVMPRTGRTNQIRIQFSEIGHPLIGEYKYLKPSKRTCVIFPRVALHALSISFLHPRNMKEVSFSSDIPQDIRILIEFLRKSH